MWNWDWIKIRREQRNTSYNVMRKMAWDSNNDETVQLKYFERWTISQLYFDSIQKENMAFSINRGRLNSLFPFFVFLYFEKVFLWNSQPQHSGDIIPINQNKVDLTLSQKTAYFLYYSHSHSFVLAYSTALPIPSSIQITNECSFFIPHSGGKEISHFFLGFLVSCIFLKFITFSHTFK